MFSEDRHPRFPDVPTHYEAEMGTQGDGELADLLSLEHGLHQVRGLIGPPEMPEAAKDYYEDVFRTVFESDRWQDFLEKNGMLAQFKGPDEYKEALHTIEDNYETMMRELGWELRGDLVEQSER
jgi:tripartite-type tricarboxylate transporter receptor subunit TctC